MQLSLAKCFASPDVTLGYIFALSGIKQCTEARYLDVTGLECGPGDRDF